MADLQYPEEAIKVAILGTGVDISHPDLRRAFSEKRIKGDRIPPDAVLDDDGHGTQLARVVLTTDPNAVLFVARVARNKEMLNSDEVLDTLLRVRFKIILCNADKQAIEWAVKENVHLIYFPLELTRDMTKIERSLDAAAQHSIIVLPSGLCLYRGSPGAVPGAETKHNINSVLTSLGSPASPAGVPGSVGLSRNQENGPTPDDSDNLVTKNSWYGIKNQKDNILFNQIRKFGGDRFDIQHYNTATTLNNMGAADAKSQRYEKALDLFQRAFTMMQRAVGTNNVCVADILDNIGLMNIALGRYSVGITLLEEAKAMKVKFLGSENPKVADTEGNLGEAYCKMGNFKKAVIHYEEGVRIYKCYFGTEHIATSRIMEELARVYHTLGEYDLAMRLYNQVLWNKRNLKEPQIEMGDTLHNTAITLQSMGQHGLAKEYFEQALAIYQSCQDSRREANTIKNIGIMYSNQCNYAEAVDCFREALEIENREYGLENPNTANTFSNLAATFGQAGKCSESIQLSQMALDITKRFRAPADVDIGDMHHNIAMVKLRRGDTRIADIRAHISESHRIFAGALGDEHVKSRKAKDLLESTTEQVTRTIKDKTARTKHPRRRMPRRRRKKSSRGNK